MVFAWTLVVIGFALWAGAIADDAPHLALVGALAVILGLVLVFLMFL